ncbi:MAG: signal peptidase II [Faecalibacterium sp.]|nr:signal peptidase II [Ruminococcus sp.]MCM1391753.1 signal peptidase II [Ruminococcus sp.]MCM1485033.1 signal peptidase II [Faecalibacterium sp.]
MIQIMTVLLIAALVGIDQIIKYFVVASLKPIGEQMLIPGFIQFRYVENDGAMMGMMQGKTTIMIIAAAIVLVVLFALIFSKKIKFGFLYACLIMIVSGGLGNIIDRIFRGFVVDYIEVLFVDFYVFNFADCLVTVSAFLIIGYEIYDMVRESKRKKVRTDD